MVAEKVEVLTKSAKVNSVGLRWVSDGTGTYEIEDVDDVPLGTQIILHLKNECREYADEERVKGMLLFRLRAYEKTNKQTNSLLPNNHFQSVDRSRPIWEKFD